MTESAAKRLRAVVKEGAKDCPYECERAPFEYCGQMRAGFTCTRPVGHLGECAACGTLAHPHETWDRQEASE